MKFPPQDKVRKREVADLARRGELSPEDQREADSYGFVGSLLSILKSKARQAAAYNGDQGGIRGAKMTKTVHGTVHGKTIELSEDLGMAEGQEIEIIVRMVDSKAGRKPGDGLLRTEGALADDSEWDAIMDEIYQDRKRDTRRQIPE